MGKRAEFDDFDIIPMTFNERTRDVLVAKGGGRPVIVMHEIYGLSPEVVAFARLLVDAGFKVYAPVLFGATDPSNTGYRRAFLCVLYEFRALCADDPGPWADWIRQLASRAYSDNPQGKGVGVIGMCVTGNLALSAALNPHVTAPVMCEPSLPVLRAGGLHISPEERTAVKMRVTDEALVIRGYRFETDKLCKAARFAELKDAFGDGFQGTCIPADRKLHSVFAGDLHDQHGNLRHGELQTLIAYLQDRI